MDFSWGLKKRKLFILLGEKKNWWNKEFKRIQIRKLQVCEKLFVFIRICYGFITTNNTNIKM